MLVKNNLPNNRSIGDLYLNPGVNEIDPKRWDNLMAKGYDRPVRGLVEDSILEIIVADKITISLVKETYDLSVLHNWMDDAKGPLKGAIKAQLKLLDLPEKE
jgi:hypothetical protein